MLRAVLAFAVFMLAAPAAAFDLPPGAEAALAHGRPYVEVQRAADGASGRIRAVIEIDAPQQTVWGLMTDCGLAPRLVPDLKSCRIVERDPKGLWDVREQVSQGPFLPSVRTVYREEFREPDRVTFHRVDGDLKVLEGEWRLTRNGEATRVTYEARASAPFAVPWWLARLALRRNVTGALAALRREALARAADDG